MTKVTTSSDEVSIEDHLDNVEVLQAGSAPAVLVPKQCREVLGDDVVNEMLSNMTENSSTGLDLPDDFDWTSLYVR